MHRLFKNTFLLAAAVVIVWMFASAVSATDDLEYLGLSRAELDRLGIEEITFDDPSAMSSTPEARAIREVTLVLQEGDTTSGVSGVVDSLNGPFVNGLGEPGFTGNAAENFVWSGNGVIWVNSDGLPSVLTGAEFTMGIGDFGAFIYGPSTDGNDSVWTHEGLLAVEYEQAVGLPAGTISTFHSRPTMVPSGHAAWVAGHGDGSGGGSTIGRILYTSTDGTPATISLIFKTGDTVDGHIIDIDGVGFLYDFSDNTAHHIHRLDMTGATNSDEFIYVDGILVAREGDPNGSGIDNWDNFYFVSINNDGDFLFSGDTDGLSSSDQFIAYNTSIILREGDTVDGVLLESGWSVRGAGINNAGHAIFGWGSGSTEHVFFACDASDLEGTGQLVLSTGDEVDLDGNGTGDATVTDAPASLIHNFQLGDDGRFFMEVQLDYGGGELEAVIGIDLPVCGLFVDGFESGDTTRWHATVP